MNSVEAFEELENAMERLRTLSSMVDVSELSAEERIRIHSDYVDAKRRALNAWEKTSRALMRELEG